MRRRVVVSGVGIVSGPSCGLDRLGEALRTSTMSASEVDRPAGYHAGGSARLAVLSRGLDLSPWIPPAMARRMSPPSRLAVAAARMALEDAGLVGSVEGPRTAVVMACAFSAIDFSERLLRTVFLEGPEAVSPFTFTESVANAAAAQIAIASQARGPNLTIIQREAGVLTAVGRGAAEISSGRADHALVGGVDEMPPILHALLDRFESLARPGSPGGEVARPFDRRRSGRVAAEGAVVLVLEAEDQARRRAAQIRARVRAFRSAFDPSASRVGWGTGHLGLARALRGMFEDLELTPAGIDRIVSGASGAVAGDRLEARTLREAWGTAPLPPILAPKGVTGEYGGGILGAAILAAANHEFGPTAGFTEPDPELGIVPHAGGRLAPPAQTLVTTVASGGAASWLLLEGV